MNNRFISEKAQKLILDKPHNFKSFGALYGWSKQQTSYRIKRLMANKDFSEEFKTKIGDLTERQKLLLYDEFGEPQNEK